MRKCNAVPLILGLLFGNFIAIALWESLGFNINFDIMFVLIWIELILWVNLEIAVQISMVIDEYKNKKKWKK